MSRMKGAVASQELFGAGFVYIRTENSESAEFIDDDNGTNSRRAKGLAICEAARTLKETWLKLNRVDDLKIMNLVILINSAQTFFRNFGLRHVNAAVCFAIGVAAPDAAQKIIARFARPVEWLRSRLYPQVPSSFAVKIRIVRSENGARRQSHERVSPGLAGYQRPKTRSAMCQVRL
jgi:hypothetical protein